MSIEVSEDESVRGVRKDVRIEGPGARIRRTVSDGRGVVEWVWVGAELVGGRDKVPIKTSRAIPTHGGTGRADFAKVSPSQRGAGEVHPLGAGVAL